MRLRIFIILSAFWIGCGDKSSGDGADTGTEADTDTDTDDTGDTDGDGWWDDPDGDDDDEDFDWGDIPDCPEDFDKDEPCEGSWEETLCLEDGLLWWCEDGTWQFDDDSDDDDEKQGFEATVDLDAGTGMYSMNFETLTEYCEISGNLTDLASVDTCADCSMAMSMTVTDIVAHEGEDCDGALDAEGRTVYFGQGTDELFEYDGTTYYALIEYDEEAGGWMHMDEGVSWITGSIWSFGFQW